MSDLSPNFSGIKDIEKSEIIRMNLQVFKICYNLLDHNGSFLIKTFNGGYENSLFVYYFH